MNCTLAANDLDAVPSTLRDRCESFHIPPLTPHQVATFFNLSAAELEQDSIKQATRDFIRQMAKRPRSISLRRVQSLINDLKVGTGEPTLN